MVSPAVLLVLVIAGSVADAFAPSIKPRAFTALSSFPNPGLDLSGNTWKPDEGKMHATDVGDFFPEGYVDELEFTDGIKGISGLTHPKVGNRDQGPELPGMEDIVANDDIVNHMLGAGLEQASDIPEGMEFIPSSVPDGQVQMRVPLVSAGACTDSYRRRS